MIKAFLVIIRPINVIIAMLSVYLGGIISFAGYYDIRLLFACLSGGLITGFGNIANDIFDIEIDRKSKPFRPLPSGKVTINQAVFMAMVLVAAGLIMAAFINRVCLLLASLVAVSLLLYTPIFKGRGYSGNALVSLISATAFFYGAAAIGNMIGGIIPAVFAFLFHFIREVVKDMEDFEADKTNGVTTGAVKYGFDFSRIIAGTMIVILIAATFIPYFMRIYGAAYLILVLLGTDIFLMYFLIRLLKSPNKQTYRFIAGFMKAIMPLGILAVFAGSRGW